MTDFVGNEPMEYGSVKIANEVVATIAGLAATEIKGVAGMSGGIKGDLTEMLGMRNLSKGVKVEVGEKETAIDIYVVIEYGSEIAKLAVEVQDNIKKTVETMTGLDVVEVNVHIQGINIPEEPEETSEPRVK